MRPFIGWSATVIITLGQSQMGSSCPLLSSPTGNDPAFPKLVLLACSHAGGLARPSARLSQRACCLKKLFGCQGKPCRRGQTVRIPTATVDVGFRDERIGSMSYLVRKNDEALCEGINFISGRYPSFNAETMQDEDIPICATQSFFEPSNP